MRRINRGGSPAPRPLRPVALVELRRDLKRHFDLPREIRHGRRAPFDRDRLLHPEVVEALDQLFRRRCAYCESKVEESAESIDHYRPVTGSRGRDRSSSPDHYGWFAYEWRNLLIVCADCRRAKGDFFPLEGPRALLLCSWAEANELEDPQLIDPSVDDPTLHFTVHCGGELIPLSERGAVTIELMRLNRPGLVAERAGQIEKLLSSLPISFESDDARAEWAEDQILHSSDRMGVAVLFVKALTNHLPAFHRPAQRTGAGWLRTLPQFVSSVPAAYWQEAQAMYRRGDPVDFMRPYDLSAADLAADWDRADPASAARVRTISIRNFKGIENLTLHLLSSEESSLRAPCVMLLGENATGKSTVLQALCLALLSPAERG